MAKDLNHKTPRTEQLKCSDFNAKNAVGTVVAIRIGGQLREYKTLCPATLSRSIVPIIMIDGYAGWVELESVTPAEEKRKQLAQEWLNADSAAAPIEVSTERFA